LVAFDVDDFPIRDVRELRHVDGNVHFRHVRRDVNDVDGIARGRWTTRQDHKQATHPEEREAMT
jgi:hypothetical protein